MKDNAKKPPLTVGEMCVFAMLGALMFASKKLMEVLPNVHLIGLLIVVTTIVFRKKALIPLYIYVFLDGIFGGFSLWWLPYLYIWTVLWGAIMLCPKRMPKAVATVVYAVLCGLHGVCFGILYAPAQALMFGLDFGQMVAWVLAGAPFDLLHALGNLAAGLFILPISEALRRFEKQKTT
jgi:hypothetical protein